MATRRLIVLGSTGSIGTQTLDVVAHLNALHERGAYADRFAVVGLSAGCNAALLAEQAAQFGVKATAIANPPAGVDLPAGAITGIDAAEQLVRTTEADIVLAAVVGVAGLPATLAAAELGRDIALANKETLVAAGELVIPAVRKSSAKLLPVDSEHAGVWQCLRGLDDAYAPPAVAPRATRRVIITASGGAFRDRTVDEVYHAAPEDALKHPNWSMGAKVTIDTASLINKGLELIEAHWLFGLGSDKLDAVIHRQSVVHAMIETADGAVLAQLGAPDMRSPIQHALTFPARVDASAERLDITSLSRLDFEPICPERFPAVNLAMRAIDEGGTAGAVLNAANEAAVEAFVARDPAVPFGRIVELVAEAMDAVPTTPVRTLADVMHADTAARAFVADRIAAGAPAPYQP